MNKLYKVIIIYIFLLLPAVQPATSGVTFISIISPIDGQTILQGSDFTITFDAPGIALLDISLVSVDSGGFPLVSNLPNSGEYIWSVTQEPGVYHLDIVEVGGIAVASSGQFEIVADLSFTLLNPVSGDSLAMYVPHSLSWDPSTLGASWEPNVTISLEKVSDGIQSLISTDTTLSLGNLLWTPHLVSSGQYRILIEDDLDQSFRSDEFNIVLSNDTQVVCVKAHTRGICEWEPLSLSSDTVSLELVSYSQIIALENDFPNTGYFELNSTELLPGTYQLKVASSTNASRYGLSAGLYLQGTDAELHWVEPTHPTTIPMYTPYLIEWTTSVESELQLDLVNDTDRYKLATLSPLTYQYLWTPNYYGEGVYWYDISLGGESLGESFKLTLEEDDSFNVSFVIDDDSVRIYDPYEPKLSWTDTFNPASVDLKLSNSTGLYPVLNGLPDNGSATLNLRQFSLGYYRLIIHDSANISRHGVTDTVKFVDSRSITITNPVQDVTWYLGTDYPIEWNITGDISEVKIHIFDITNEAADKLTVSASANAGKIFVDPDVLGEGIYRAKLIGDEVDHIYSESGKITVVAQTTTLDSSPSSSSSSQNLPFFSYFQILIPIAVLINIMNRRRSK